jgi:ABC-type uncharacterized transport system involved in gliding motility auxiliary subunit
MSNTKHSHKKNNLRKIGSISLWISGFALLSTILLLVVKLLVLSKIYTLPNSHAFNWAIGISALAIILGLSLYTLIDPQHVRELLIGRQIRHGSNIVLKLLAFIGILLVINIFVFQNPGKPMDFTEDKQNSLANETLVTLKSLPSAVQATAFYSSQTPSDTTQILLENYKNFSNGKFSYSFIDPDQNPMQAQQAGITGDGKIFLQMGESHEIVSYASEQEITSGLIRLMNPGKQTIFFLTGHGERDIQNASDTAFTIAKSALEAKNYSIQSLNLIAQNLIPSNAKVIVIAGPTQPISINEQTLLQEYVSNGGALVIMEEPRTLTQSENIPDPLTSYLSTTWGITFDNDIVIDTNTNQPIFAVAATYGSHPITEKLQGLVSFYPTACSLSLSTNIPNKPIALVDTINSAWGEIDFSSLQSTGQAVFDQSIDVPGPLTLAAAVENAATSSHIVVFCDSDFASNVYFDQYANGDIFINSIDWAAGQEQLINLTAPSIISRTLVLPGSFWLLVMSLSFLCFLPGLVILGGVITFVIRRSRG